MPTCGECKQYPWMARPLMIHGARGIPIHPAVQCKADRRTLVWHDHRAPVTCGDFEPREGAEDA